AAHAAGDALAELEPIDVADAALELALEVRVDVGRDLPAERLLPPARARAREAAVVVVRLARIEDRHGHAVERGEDVEVIDVLQHLLLLRALEARGRPRAQALAQLVAVRDDLDGREEPARRRRAREPEAADLAPHLDERRR